LQDQWLARVIACQDARVAEQESRDDPGVPLDGIDAWLRGLAPSGGLARKAETVVDVLRRRPRLASYASTAEVARLAGANVGTVTRTAQALGFAGWPALQQELRARYLSSLSAPEVAAEHATGTTPSGDSLRRDLEGLSLATRRLPPEQLSEVARAIAAAGRTVVAAAGSYAAVGTVLVHNGGLAGYDLHLAVDEAGLANAASRLGPQDVLVVISFWRLYESAVRAAEQARRAGATVVALTDSASSALAQLAHHVLVVPAEGVAFFPSLTCGVAVAQALVAELAGVDPGLTRRTIEAAEASWGALGLLHRKPRSRRIEEPEG
jgi:DNA-binding MurR/RpiR family transcriptional regulator